MSRNRPRRNNKNGDSFMKMLVAAVSILALITVLSSIKGKSPLEYIQSIYYWGVGKESPNPSRAELQTKINTKDIKIDSLSSVIAEIEASSPYRTAIVNTTANSLNLRSMPNLSSDVVIKIPDSSAVKILYFDEEVLVLDGETGKWCKIQYADKEGWVWGNYLELQD